MTQSSRPRVLTEQDAGTMDTLIKRGESAASAAEQKTAELQGAANDLTQLKASVPAAAKSAADLATAQAKSTLDTASGNANSAAAAALASLATLPKFRSADQTNPPNPTQAELDANPNGIWGVKLNADGVAQQLKWQPHTLAGSWQSVGAPPASAQQVERARLLAVIASAFDSTNSANPRNPTAEEIAAFQAANGHTLIGGSRINAEGWRQPLIWQGGAWVVSQALPKLDTGLLADIAQSTELNNAATAQNLGRKTAPSVAAVGPEAGLYNITSGADAGQVWERLAGGGVERRAGLEAASAAQLGVLDNRTAQIVSATQQPGADSNAKLLAAQAAAGETGGIILPAGLVGADQSTLSAARAAEMIYGIPSADMSGYAVDHRDHRSVANVRLYQATPLQDADDGYLAYGLRVEAVTTPGQVVSTVASQSGIISYSDSTGVPEAGNRTNMLAHVASAVGFGSASVEAVNAIATSHYSGGQYIQLIGVEADIAASQPAGFFGQAGKSLTIGVSSILIPADAHVKNNGTAAFSSGSEDTDFGWLHGAYLAEVKQAGLSVWGKPDYGTYVAAAAVAHYIGPKPAITNGVEHHAKHNPNWADAPLVGVWHGQRAAQNGASITQRLTATDAAGAEVHWDISASAYEIEVLKNGQPAIKMSPYGIWVQGVKILAPQQPPIAGTDGSLGETNRALEQVLAMLRVHGLIAP